VPGRVRHPSNPEMLNVARLARASAAMVLQMAAGSALYPTYTGRIVLLATAAIVAMASRRWTR
jgi:hypothetical protein